MKKTILTILTAFLCMHLTAQRDAYLFSYFKGQSDGLLLAYSYDGLNWNDLTGANPIMRPVIGRDSLLRDPSICQGPDGTYHMVWTSSWHDRIIGHASSRDLIHWSKQDSIGVMMHEPEAKNCWAPELFYDSKSKLYYIYWATTIPGRHSEVADTEREKGWNHRIYYVTTRDFRKFSKTKMFFNPSFSAIDAAFIADPFENDYFMVVKNENPNPPEKNIRVTRTKSLKKGFPVEVSAPITGNYWCEGPAPLYVGDTLYVYFDKYRNHTYGAVRSLDHGKTWSDVSTLCTFPKGMRHGTAFKITEEMLDKLLRYYKK